MTRRRPCESRYGALRCIETEVHQIGGELATDRKRCGRFNECTIASGGTDAVPSNSEHESDA